MLECEALGSKISTLQQNEIFNPERGGALSFETLKPRHQKHDATSQKTAIWPFNDVSTTDVTLYMLDSKLLTVLQRDSTMEEFKMNCRTHLIVQHIQNVVPLNKVWHKTGYVRCMCMYLYTCTQNSKSMSHHKHCASAIHERVCTTMKVTQHNNRKLVPLEHDIY